LWNDVSINGRNGYFWSSLKTIHPISVNNSNGPRLNKYNFSTRFNALNLPELYKNDMLIKSNSDLVMNSNGLNNNGNTEYVEMVDSIANIEHSWVDVKTSNL